MYHGYGLVLEKHFDFCSEFCVRGGVTVFHNAFDIALWYVKWYATFSGKRNKTSEYREIARSVTNLL